MNDSLTFSRTVRPAGAHVSMEHDLLLILTGFLDVVGGQRAAQQMTTVRLITHLLATHRHSRKTGGKPEYKLDVEICCLPMNISEITSSRVGYEDPSYFSREYKKLFGAPPQRDIARLRSREV